MLVVSAAMAFLVVAIITGALYQFIAGRRAARRYAAPGFMIEVGGQRLHILCAGRGQPAVLFESGIAASSMSWAHILPEVSAFTRACAYDRAGFGWSAAASGPRTAARMLRELGGVLASTGATGPHVLVGHSFGAFLVCAYAAAHPDEVAGVILIDPPSEWHHLTRDRAYLVRGGIHLSRVGGLLARIGVVRASLALLTGGAPGIPRNVVRVFGPTAAGTLERLVGEVRKLPPEVQRTVQALWCQPKCFRAMADHLRALEEVAATAASVSSLRNVPLTVLSSGQQPPETITKHRELATLSTRGRHIVAAASGHWVQFDEPSLVVNAVRDLVEHARHTTAA